MRKMSSFSELDISVGISSTSLLYIQRSPHLSPQPQLNSVCLMLIITQFSSGLLHPLTLHQPKCLLRIPIPIPIPIPETPYFLGIPCFSYQESPVADSGLFPSEQHYEDHPPKTSKPASKFKFSV